MYPGADDDAYIATLEKALSVFNRFKPDYFVVSLGLDIMAGDPTGAFSITTKGMRRIGELFGGLKQPKLIVQEGGYTLRNLRTGATAFFTGILS
jgi:acetoin utilization deacetylase AcuC-like enzyme